MLRKWVVGGGGLDGYFGEQGLPAGIQECLERFSAGSLFQNGTARMVKANWRRRVQHSGYHTVTLYEPSMYSYSTES